MSVVHFLVRLDGRARGVTQRRSAPHRGTVGKERGGSDVFALHEVVPVEAEDRLVVSVPLVGREEEVELLHNTFARTVRDAAHLIDLLRASPTPSLITAGVSAMKPIDMPLTSTPSISPRSTCSTKTTLQRSWVAARTNPLHVHGQITSQLQFSK